jgi:hypothetical protein
LVRFNAVGRDELAREVLVPKTDPAVRRRTVIILGFALLALFALVLVVANPFGVTRGGGSGSSGRSFDPPPAGEAGP